MARLVVTEFVSLDGVMGEPQEWTFPYWGDDMARFKHDELLSSDVQLLGRKTYETFAAAWPSRSGDYADRLNASPKVVVSTKLADAAWNNSRIVKENLREGVREVKAQSNGDVLVHGSKSLVQWLTEEALVDEYRLVLFPLVLGQGTRLFDTADSLKLQLKESRAFDSGVMLLRYEPSR